MEKTLTPTSLLLPQSTPTFVSLSDPTNSPMEQNSDIIPGIYKIEHASIPNCVIDLSGGNNKTILGRFIFVVSLTTPTLRQSLGEPAHGHDNQQA